MEEQLKRFFELFLQSIDSIHPEYYHTVYNNIFFQDHPSNKSRYVRDGILHRFGERVFSYELYHKLRNRIEDERRINPTFFENCFLQGELKKFQIAEILAHYNIERLPKDFIPDMLMHTPSSMDLNAFIIEIKVAQNLTASLVKKDILKISYFIERYHYCRGVFCALHTTLDQIGSFIHNSRYTSIVRNLPREISNRIYIVTKNWHNEETQVCLLSEI